MINYSFLKALTTANSNMQKYLLSFQRLNLYSRKTANVQILFKGICEKTMPNFFAKIVQYASFCSWLSKEL